MSKCKSTMMSPIVFWINFLKPDTVCGHDILIVCHLYCNFFQHVINAVILCAMKLILHLHPLSYVIEVIQVEKGVFQSCDGAVRIQQTTHVEFVAVSLVP